MALPVNGSTHLIPAYYSFYDRERLSWPSWLTYSGWLTHNSGHPSAAGRAQDRESLPARDRRSTTVPRHQLKFMCCCQIQHNFKFIEYLSTLLGVFNFTDIQALDIFSVQDLETFDIRHLLTTNC